METEEETTEHTPEPTPEPHHSDDLATIVHALETKVDGVIETVSGLEAKLEIAQADSTPTSVPWTHRKFS